VVTFNRAGEEILGYTKEELVGRPAEILWKDPGERARVIQMVMEQGAVTNYKTSLVGKQGQEVEISLAISQLKDPKGRVLGTVGISRDITEESRLRKRLLEQERLAAIGQTVAGIAHCMKNIINGLKGGAYLVETAIKRRDESLLKEGWEGVKKSIDWIGRLSLDMLSYCRESATGLIPVDLGALLRETVDMMMPYAMESGVHLRLTCEVKGTFYLDSDGVKRMLLNLISNAIDACREKEYTAIEKPLTEVVVTELSERILIEVKDNGTGMGEEEKSKVFKRFFTTKGNKGTGLGLCVTHKVVQEMGGEIDFDSQKGKGTTFKVYLPKLPYKGPSV
jgi:PAS domain S-box-containing protein